MNLELTKEEYGLLMEVFAMAKTLSTELSIERMMSLIAWFEGNNEEIAEFNRKLLVLSNAFLGEK